MESVSLIVGIHLKLEDTCRYGAKIRPLLHDSLNDSLITRCPIARHHTIKDIEENNWSHDQNVR